MQFVCTEGQLTLEPVPGSEEGTVSGYLLKAKDASTGVELVIAMSHEHAAKLGAGMVKHTEENPVDAAPSRLVVADSTALHALPKHPAKPRRRP